MVLGTVNCLINIKAYILCATLCFAKIFVGIYLYIVDLRFVKLRVVH